MRFLPQSGIGWVVTPTAWGGRIEGWQPSGALGLLAVGLGAADASTGNVEAGVKKG